MAKPAHIATRRVLMIPGFDPNPARTHRERYRREGQRQAEISGYALELIADPETAPAAWRVEARIEGQRTEARIEVLAWSDLVSDLMRKPLQGYGQMLRTVWVYLTSGAFGPMLRLRKGPVIAALYPISVIMLQLLVACALGAGLIYGLFLIRDAVLDRDHDYALAISIVFSPALAIPILRWFETHDGRVLAHYLLRDYAFASAERGAYPEALSARLDAFSAALIAAAEGPEDEVLLVGHSSGAYLAVTVLADALRSGAVPEDKQVALLTLGHVVPMVSFLPKAHRLRADLAYLSASDRITWVDVTAPGDGCSFALCDPVAVSGVSPAGKRWPLMISAAFRQTLAPETWDRLKRRFFRLHFQYMCAFDLPGDYDFFAITAGPLSLADRFAGRAPSPGRIETPVNRHRGLAP